MLYYWTPIIIILFFVIENKNSILFCIVLSLNYLCNCKLIKIINLTQNTILYV